ncbi:MAG: stalk domain-containing protein [Firmicutes bacterium]|nr:stalk domain-containing protein [Bacillota bacterium]
MLSAILLLALCGAAGATVGSKQINVNYNNVTIYTNGKAVTVAADQEPFLIKGVTYVPLRVAGEALNCDVNWDPNAKKVLITTKSTATATDTAILKAQLTQKDQQIADLQQKVASLQNQLDTSSKNISSGNSLSSLESTLYNKYSDWKNITIDSIKLSGDANNVSVQVQVDLSRYGYQWSSLQNSDIQSWLNTIVGAIQDQYSSSTGIDGSIVNLADKATLAVFSNNGGDSSLSVIFQDKNYRGGSSSASSVENDLLSTDYSVGNMRFSVYQVKYYSSDNSAFIYLDSSNSNAATQWSKLSYATIQTAVGSIGDDINRQYSAKNVTLSYVRLYFYDNNNNLLNNYKYNLE